MVKYNYNKKKEKKISGNIKIKNVNNNARERVVTDVSSKILDLN